MHEALYQKEQERNKTILKEHPELSEEDLSVSKMPLETTDAEQEDVSAIEDLVLQQDASAKQEQKIMTARLPCRLFEWERNGKRKCWR